MRARGNYIEEQLLAGFRLGQEKSFTEVFNALYPALCFYALRYTYDQAAAEDIAEESFIKIWDRRETFYQFNVLKSYLYTTVRNAAINWKKQQQRRWAYEKEMATTPPVTETYVLDDIIRSELLREVYTALDTLPPQCRKIFSMLYVDGKTTRQVAEELDLSIGTVTKQKARGLILLRKRLPQLLLLLSIM